VRPVDTARLALQALQRYPLRTAMLLVAISIGVAAVVMLTAVGEGARRYVTGQFQSLGTHLLIVLPGKAETSGAGVQGMLIGETARELTLADTMAVGRSARIAQVTPVVVGSGTISWRERERDITVLGTSTPMAAIQLPATRTATRAHVARRGTTQDAASATRAKTAATIPARPEAPSPGTAIAVPFR